MHQPWRMFAIVCLVAVTSLAMAPGANIPAARAQGVCVQLIQNGGFESDGAWLLGTAPQIPEYVTYAKHGGNRSLAMGIFRGLSQLSYSSARQTVTIPATANTVTLSFWFNAWMTDPVRNQHVELVLLAPDNATLDIPWRSQTDTRVWNYLSFDVSRWRGRTLQVYFNVYNDGQGGTAGMFLDDVSLIACSTGSPFPSSTITPPTPTPTRTNTPLVPIWTVTNTPYYITPTSGPIVATPTWTPYYITPTSGPIVATPTWTPYYWTPTPYYWTPTPYYWTPTPYYWTPSPGPGYPTVSPYPMTPWPSNCIDLIKNGAFDYGFAGWFPSENKLPVYLIGSPVLSPPYALHLGTESQPIKSYSSVRQYVTIPAGTRATLQFWTWARAEPNAGADRQEAILLASNDTVLTVLWRVLADERTWRQIAIDLTPYAGRSVAIYFNAYNDGGGGRTALLLDNVQLLACGSTRPPPGPVTVLPPITLGTPTVLPEPLESFEVGLDVADDALAPPASTSAGRVGSAPTVSAPAVRPRSATASALTSPTASAIPIVIGTVGVAPAAAVPTASVNASGLGANPPPAMTYVSISQAPQTTPTPRPSATPTPRPTATATPPPSALQQMWDNLVARTSPAGLLSGLVLLGAVAILFGWFVWPGFHRPRNP